MDMFDYIIIGAGSAGCVLANRLSANPDVSVLLLEAGGSDAHPYVGMPKGMAKLVRNPKLTWVFPIKQARREGLAPQEAWIRGKALGGSSTINGMIYSRGQPQDYDEWNTLGGPGWGWQDMKAVFKKMESHQLGEADARGGDGPLPVSSGTLRYRVAEAMIAAGEQFGVKRKDDLNDEVLEGVGYYNHTIKNGRRMSAARVFLDPAKRRPNLTVVTGAHVEKVLFTQGPLGNQTATGVACQVNGQARQFNTRGEVIVSAGALLSPKILQLSGIGPRGLLESLGINCLHDSPDVGRRMREHLSFSMPHRLRNARGLNHRFRGLGLIFSVLQYYLTHTGPMATGPFEIGAFVRSMPGANKPDTQIYLGAFNYARTEGEFPVQLAEPDSAPGLTIYGQLLNLTSEGEVMITSSDPKVPPQVTPNWMTTAYDRAAMIAMVRTMRKYIAQPALADYVGEELIPGPDCQTDAQITEALHRLATSGLHAIGSCRMGKDEGSVVDSRLQVRGVSGLRVVDCSIMPSLVSGNTNGPAMAVGWRASDLILEDAS